jgi:ketosteroid isomerase-like protein
MSQRHADARVARVVELFESLKPDDVSRLGRFYATNVRFKDPFNEVQGVPAVQQVFAHMFTALHDPGFVVRDIIVQDGQCFLSWEFNFRFKRFSDAAQTVRGASHLRFDAHGLVDLHRDYWDAAEELYEKLPVVGALMRWLKARAKQ